MEQMTIYQFADELIITGDLDPVYVALVAGKLEQAQLERWILAYSMFYHMGVSSYMSEFTNGRYWDQISKAAANATPSPLGGRWPRGTERRHFRGSAAIEAVESFRDQPPEDWVRSLYQHKTADMAIQHVVRCWPLFGPWIGFKLSDLLEVVVGCSLTFSHDIPIMYKEPRACLDMLKAETNRTGMDIYNDLIDHVSARWEPAAGRRVCGVQEAETVLCKYKSYRNAHYWVGKDTAEIRHHLSGWGDTAEWLLRHAPAYRGAA